MSLKSSEVKDSSRIIRAMEGEAEEMEKVNREAKEKRCKSGKRESNMRWRNQRVIG